MLESREMARVKELATRVAETRKSISDSDSAL
jgi:hypothetical protein